MESTLRAPSIDPGAYLSADTLEEELHRIWPSAWHLLALTRDLPNDKDYLRKRVARTDLVLHRLGERIIAYANVCPHRFSTLVDQPSGNAPLQCPYHLWSFDTDGYPSAVPHRQGIPLAEFTQGARLSTWQVALVGEFIFVSKQPIQSCEDYLGALGADLARMSRALGNELPPVTLDVAANWKIIAQNTVELQHAYSVHPGTFAALSSKPMRIDSDLPLANSISYVMRLKPERFEGRLNARLKSLLSRVEQPFPDGYRHHLIFPATTLGYVDNRMLTIIDYQPLTAGACRMSARMFEFVVPDLSPLEASILASIRPLDHQFSLQVFEEDGGICEAVQRGLHNRPADMPGVLMPVEHMVARFQDMYQQWMDYK
ncbi:SRPBCC family protein [Pseudomonas sp. HR96]|uniref:aromatic ring-hydroxylating oxygenase subunit alpha n=1 Tax=Pseudomonas sp. HR96 TaxID=1027966 RepID=UPI002A75F24D|nr:SRPBCC family protein [Pseudomonas sp. HR96]WPP01279.1 SRPBCC family protein [Pseudomonas sp. HR96]